MKNKHFTTRTFTIIFFLAIINTVSGQDSAWTIYNTLNSGLPYNSVHEIAFDGNGDKWIATYGAGLCKFDGINWTVYNTLNSGLPHNNVEVIVIDNSGNKWIGTTCCGLGHYDGITWSVYNISNSGLPDNYVDVITVDGEGNMWIGTRGGLAKYNGTTWTVYKQSNSGLPSDWIEAITCDRNGVKWIGTTFEVWQNLTELIGLFTTPQIPVYQATGLRQLRLIAIIINGLAPTVGG